MIQPTRHRFTTDDYHAMIEAGVLTPDTKVELIFGEIIDVAPMGSKHAYTIQKLAKDLLFTYSDKAVVWIQCPVSLPPRSEPEPDLALLKMPEDAYASRLPVAEDVRLIIEVSDSTLLFDRTTKLELYASAAIPELWIVNLLDEQLEVYREPSGTTYKDRLTCKPGEATAPLAFEDTTLNWW